MDATGADQLTAKVVLDGVTVTPVGAAGRVVGIPVAAPEAGEAPATFDAVTVTT